VKRLTVIGGDLVAVTVLPGDARSLDVRRLRRADPSDTRPVQWHAWAAGYGSAFGDTVAEACDALATTWATAAAAAGAGATPPPGMVPPRPGGAGGRVRGGIIGAGGRCRPQ
jgi:hypothetical protein